MSNVDVRARAVARHTRGLARTSDLRAAGIASSVISRRIARGVWELAVRGVVDVTGEEWCWERRVLAAVLACPDGTLASHRTAGVLWELPSIVAGRAIEVTTPRPNRSAELPFRVHSTLRPTGATQRRGVPTTPLLRTVVDLGTCATDREYARVWSHVLRQGSVEIGAVASSRYDHLHGVTRARAFADAEHASTVRGTESPLELDVLTRLREERWLPRFIPQHRVHLDGRELRLDAAWPDRRVCVEVDGARWHADRLSQAADRERQELLERHGWTVIRVSARDLVDAAAWQLVLGRLRHALT